MSVEPSKSACFGGFHVVGRQAAEHFGDVQSRKLTGHFGHCFGSEKGWRGVEAVMDSGMIKELDGAARIPRDTPFENLDARPLDTDAPAEPDQAPDRPVEIHGVLRGRVPLGIAVR